MNPKPISILMVNFLAGCPFALADDGMVWSGSAGIGLRGVNETARDPSKLNEYRDLDSGVIGIFDVRGRSDDYYINAFGENLGRDDQYLDLRGGKYGVFKYRLYDNELRHNFGSGPGALSPYSGIGGATLTARFPSLNPAAWNGFDNSYTRQDIGGMFEFSGNSPWYVRVDGNQVERDGVKVIAAAQGASPGNGFVELPSPVDFRTRNFSVEGGYQSKRGHIAVNWLQSKFSNGNDVLRWSNGFFAPGFPASYDTTVLPPDNDLTRLGINGNLRLLPLGSTAAARVTYSKLSNDVSVLPTVLSTGNTNPATASSSPTFHGEHINKTASLSLTSHPIANLDTRLYWNWASMDNKSTALRFTPTAASGLQCTGAPCVPELFHFRKNNFGAEAAYRLSAQNKLSGGVDYHDMKRERVDFHSNEDWKYYAEWKNSSLDTLDARVKYQYMQRRSDFVGSTTGIDSFVRRFDLASVNQDLVKIVLDYTPVPLLDFGAEAIYKNNDYKNTILGRTDDERQEYYLSVSYGDPKSFRVMLFGDIEFAKFDSLHRVGAGNPDPSAPPSGAPFSTTYTWSARNKDKSWQVGLGADWVPSERWKVNASLIWAKTEGTADFGTQPGTILAAPLLKIGNFDNTTRTALNLKGTYSFSRQWDFTAGYAFERYRYSDIGFDCTGSTVATCPYIAPTVPPGGTATSYLTGQTAFQDYTVNIVYLIATYKF